MHAAEDDYAIVLFDAELTSQALLAVHSDVRSDVFQVPHTQAAHRWRADLHKTLTLNVVLRKDSRDASQGRRDERFDRTIAPQIGWINSRAHAEYRDRATSRFEDEAWPQLRFNQKDRTRPPSLERTADAFRSIPGHQTDGARATIGATN